MSQLSVPLAPGVPLESLFARVFIRLNPRRTLPQFRIEFRPFAGLRSHIFLQHGRALVRISDVLEGSPEIVLEALAEILLSQVHRRRPSREARECYLAYVCRPEFRRRIDQARRTRLRLRLAPPQGRHYDLAKIFARLNRRFFDDQLAPCRIGWSPRPARTVLGGYDPAHGAITISRTLDSPKVPLFVVEYLVFHEMLHSRFPVQRRGQRRVVHSPEFRRAEMQFPHYRKAKARLKKAFCY
jgi:hypothetical protein